MEEIDKKVIESYKTKSTRKVADEFGISQTQVRRILKRNNVKTVSLKTSDDIENKVISLYKDNISSEKIAVELSIMPATVCKILKRNGIEIKSASHFNRKYKINENYLDVIDTEEKAYFLGFMYADGCVHAKKRAVSIVLHAKDIDILKKFSDVFYGFEKLHITEDNYIAFRIYSTYICYKLIEHGCFAAKTFKISLPSTVPSYLYKDFLRGFYDGDGCIHISKDKKRVRLTLTGYIVFLNQVKNFFEKNLNVSGVMTIVKPNVADFTFHKNKDVEKVLDYLYGDSTIYLQRKYEKYLEAKEILSIKNKPALKYGTDNIIAYNGIKLSAKNILSMSAEEKLKAAEHVFKTMRENGFPYPKFSNNELIADFNSLKKYKIDISDNQIKSCGNSGLKIFKHFSEHYFDVRSKQSPSMSSSFEDDNKLRAVIHNRMGISYKETFNITGNMIRQGFRNSHKSFAASIFKPTVAKSVYDTYAPEDSTVLDISMGFGQRMLGAMASDKVKKYIGIDPWIDQVNSGKEIVDFFKFDNVEIFQEGSEVFRPKELNQAIDFCFSSPPFFDKEIYCTKSTQANVGNFDDFIHWWNLTCQNLKYMLKDGATFVLNMDYNMGLKMIESNDCFELIDEIYIEYMRKHLPKNSRDTFFILKRKS